MKKYKVALVAACDRYNYGDVLLPVVFEQYWRSHHSFNADNVEFNYFALSVADLTEVGGYKTQPLTKVDGSYDAVIVCGGEILTSRYANMFLNLQRLGDRRIIFKAIKAICLVSYDTADFICKKLLHGRNKLPWCFYPLSESQKVFYNAVGGCGIPELKKELQVCLYDTVDSSTVFSVRDGIASKFMSSGPINKKVQLIPDTAMLMSEVFDINTLNTLISDKVKKYNLARKSYFIVQLNRRYGEDKVEDFAEGIERIIRKTGLKCMLLTIGRAQGHEDYLPLSAIKQYFHDDSVIYINEGSIYDIMYYIANSYAFVGTSLHGIISAASFKVPHTVATSSAKKTLGYLETWRTSNVLCVENTQQFFNFVCRPDIDCTLQDARITQYKKTVSEYFDFVINIMNEKEQK